MPVLHFQPLNGQSQEAFHLGGLVGRRHLHGCEKRLPGPVKGHVVTFCHLQRNARDKRRRYDIPTDEHIVIDGALLAEGANDVHWRGKAAAGYDPAEFFPRREVEFGVSLTLDALGLGEVAGRYEPLAQEKLADFSRHPQKPSIFAEATLQYGIYGTLRRRSNRPVGGNGQLTTRIQET